MKDTFTYKIPIGDWSRDGHGQCDYYTITSNKNADALRVAYNTMADLSPELAPDSFCKGYQDGLVPEHVQAKLKEIGGFYFYEYRGEESVEFGSEGMIKYVLWWLKAGDPELELELQVNAPEIILAERRDHNTSFIGYGLFGY